MAENTLDKALNIRMSQEELDQIEGYRKRLQVQLGPRVKVTQRTVVLTAMDRLEAHLVKLEKERAKNAAAKALKETEDL